MRYPILLFAIIFILIPERGHCRHLVGATMHYKHTVGTRYEFELRITRDCQSLGAELDPTAAIGLFDPTNQLAYAFDAPLASTEMFMYGPDSNCLGFVDVCLEEGKYFFTIDIGMNLNGWSVAYQRCCRRIDLINVEDAEDTGMTIQTMISTDDFNRGAEITDTIFKLAIVNSPFFYDVSTTDPDGDSLVYSLLTPLNGGDPFNIKPDPPSAPSYLQIGWASPYEETNMLGGQYPLQIHPHTGLITAIPLLLGPFQIAYGISEYRNGTLIAFRGVEVIVQVIHGVNVDQTFKGTVLTSNAQPVDQGIATLIEHRLSDDSLFILEEQEFVYGNYDFTNIPLAALYIKAEPGQLSNAHHLFAPTYWPRSAFWYGAEIITQCESPYPLNELALLPLATHTMGNISVTGTIDDVRTAAPPKNVSVFLMQGDSIAGYSHVDENGIFEIQNLATGLYDVYVDAINTSVYNAFPPQIQIVANTTITARLHDNHLEITQIVSIETPTGKLQEKMKAYFISTDELVIETNIQQAQDQTVYVYDIRGSLISSFIFPSGAVLIRQQFSNTPPGVYVINVSDSLHGRNHLQLKALKP